MFESPAVLRDDSAVVGAPLYGFSSAAAVLAVEYLAGHNLDARAALRGVASSHSADSQTVVVDGRDYAGYVGAVVLRVDVIAVRGEVVTVAPVTFLLGVMPHIGGQVLVVEIYAAVHDAHYHLRRAGDAAVPDRQDVDVAAAGGRVGCTFIYIVPLGRQQRVIERIGREGRGLGCEEFLFDGHCLASDMDEGSEFYIFYTGDGDPALRCFRNLDGRVVADLVPAVQAFRTCACLEFSGIREQPAHTHDATAVE